MYWLNSLLTDGPQDGREGLGHKTSCEPAVSPPCSSLAWEFSSFSLPPAFPLQAVNPVVGDEFMPFCQCSCSTMDSKTKNFGHIK